MWENGLKFAQKNTTERIQHEKGKEKQRTIGVMKEYKLSDITVGITFKPVYWHH